MGMHSAEEPATAPLGLPQPDLSPYQAWYGEVAPRPVEPPPSPPSVALADRFAGVTWPQVVLVGILGVLAVALVMVLTGQAASAGTLVSSTLLIGAISVVVSARIRRRNY